jgi:hypothetical protein
MDEIEKRDPEKDPEHTTKRLTLLMIALQILQTLAQWLELLR